MKYVKIYNERKLSAMKIERFHTYEDESSKVDDEKYNQRIRLPLSPEQYEATERIRRHHFSPPEIKFAAFQPTQTLRLKLSDGDVVYVNIGNDDQVTISKPTSEKSYSYKFITGSDEQLPAPDGFDNQVIQFIKNSPNIDWDLKEDYDTDFKYNVIYRKDIETEWGKFQVEIFGDNTYSFSYVSDLRAKNDFSSADEITIPFVRKEVKRAIAKSRTESGDKG